MGREAEVPGPILTALLHAAHDNTCTTASDNFVHEALDPCECMLGCAVGILGGWECSSEDDGHFPLPETRHGSVVVAHVIL